MSLVHVKTRSFMVSLSTFCFMLALAWIYPLHVFQPKIHQHAYRLLHHPRRRFHPNSIPMQRPVWPTWRRSNPLIDLQNLRRLITLVSYDGPHHLTIPASSRSDNYTRVAIVRPIGSRHSLEIFCDKKN